jgi:hypothetical protein
VQDADTSEEASQPCEVLEIGREDGIAAPSRRRHHDRIDGRCPAHLGNRVPGGLREVRVQRFDLDPFEQPRHALVRSASPPLGHDDGGNGDPRARTGLRGCRTWSVKRGRARELMLGEGRARRRAGERRLPEIGFSRRDGGQRPGLTGRAVAGVSLTTAVCSRRKSRPLPRPRRDEGGRGRVQPDCPAHRELTEAPGRAVPCFGGRLPSSRCNRAAQAIRVARGRL